MVSFYYVFLFWLLGTLSTVMVGVRYTKSLRGQTKKEVKDTELMLMSLLLGGPVIIFLYFLIPEIKREDSINRYRLIIVSSVITIIEIIAIVLLFHFGIFTWIEEETENTVKLLTSQIC